MYRHIERRFLDSNPGCHSLSFLYRVKINLEGRSRVRFLTVTGGVWRLGLLSLGSPLEVFKDCCLINEGFPLCH